MAKLFGQTAKRGRLMKQYIVTLSIGVTAQNEVEAKKEFWVLVDDSVNDGFINNNSLEVKED
jgi:hypothetical protein